MTTPKYAYLYVMSSMGEFGYEFIIEVPAEEVNQPELHYHKFWSRNKPGIWSPQKHIHRDSPAWVHSIDSWDSHEQKWLTEDELFAILL
jgi:hypothetical protein